mmetsp:Transcript_11183/g.20126  ORF Transcript_11183/g.20126 Transcript_11183/m.20126 type:complete len:209 (+) Transcript_11183:1322-1948(+)
MPGGFQFSKLTFHMARISMGSTLGRGALPASYPPSSTSSSLLTSSRRDAARRCCRERSPVCCWMDRSRPSAGPSFWRAEIRFFIRSFWRWVVRSLSDVFCSSFRVVSYSMYSSSSEARSMRRCWRLSSNCWQRDLESLSCCRSFCTSPECRCRLCTASSCSIFMLAWELSSCLHRPSTLSMLSFCFARTVCRWSLPWRACFASSFRVR